MHQLPPPLPSSWRAVSLSLSSPSLSSPLPSVSEPSLRRERQEGDHVCGETPECAELAPTSSPRQQGV